MTKLLLFNKMLFDNCFEEFPGSMVLTWLLKNEIGLITNLWSKMSAEGKKISFSFSKVKKTSLAGKVNVEPKEKVEYVDCFDGAKGTFSFKGNVKTDPFTKQELVIPLISTKTSSDIIKARIEERAKKPKIENLNGTDSNKNENIKINCKDPSKSIEELAALEILKDIKNNPHEGKDSNQLIIEASETSNQNEPESEADIDYENVPVSDFGLAMLRGMGWKPGCGIGKEPRVVETISVKLRPKGLGLGAKTIPETKEEKPMSKSSKS